MSSVQGDYLRDIVIVGGGTAGWMTAAVLARAFPNAELRITLIESEEIGIVGVGEATVPILQQLNRFLGIDERDFLKATNGTYKLGIEFRDWAEIGDIFFHGFGDYGPLVQGIQPHHHWLKLRELGDPTPIDEYAMPYAMALRGRFAIIPPEAQNRAAGFNHAFHFDAGLYGRFLRSIAERLGVSRVEGKIVDVALHSESGDVDHVTLTDGREFSADLFVDCSGFRGLLIEEALHTGYEEWTRWLPCDRAVAVGSEVVSPPTPFTRSTAQKSGWQWRIPLQHRVGNGHVYSSAFISDEDARETLLANLDGNSIGEPRLLKFTTGRRKQAWNRNCVAIGLAAGFMEPLESTSIQLIQSAAVRLVDYFPKRGFDPVAIGEYNRLSTNEQERIRDFLIAHYCLTHRTDSEFWRHCAAMEVPETLAHKIELFAATGRVALYSEESFQEPSWAAIFLGNGLIPKTYHPLVDFIPEDELRRILGERRTEVARMAEAMPTHQAFIERFCLAPSV